MGFELPHPISGWSRRQFVARGLLALAALPAIARAGLAPRSVRRATPPRHKAGGSGVLSSTSGAGGRLTTAVRVNGRGPYHFLVDTGSERTVLAEDVAEQLKLPRGAGALVQGIVRSIQEPMVRIESLELGRLRCARLEVPILPRSLLVVDGILGLDVLDGHRVVFDFASRTLTVKRREGFFSALWTGVDEVRVHTRGDFGRLRATNCRIDGVHAAAFIDSGAQVSVSNRALDAACRRGKPPSKEAATIALSGVTGGTTLGRVAFFEKIRVGELILTNTPVVVADLEIFKLWGLRHQPALLIGMDCLRRCSWVSIDYGRKVLKFEVPNADVRPAEMPVLQPIL